MRLWKDEIKIFFSNNTNKKVKKELTIRVNEQLESFDNMLDKEVENFNKEFNALNLNYLSIEKTYH